jgi:hypothetical protein
VKDFPTDKKKVGAGGKVIENFSMVSVALDVAESCKTWNCPSHLMTMKRYKLTC